MSWKPEIERIAKHVIAIDDRMGTGTYGSLMGWAEKVFQSPQQWLDTNDKGFMKSSYWTMENLMVLICWEKWKCPFYPLHPMALRYPRVPWDVMKVVVNAPQEVERWGIRKKELAPFLGWLNWKCRTKCGREEYTRKWEGRWGMEWRKQTIIGLPKAIMDANFRYRDVFEWAVRKKDWAGWERPFEMGYNPQGEMMVENISHIMDEIQVEDIHFPNASPEAVIRNALMRRMNGVKEMMRRWKLDYPEMPWKSMEGIVQIRRSDELADRADELNNCSAGLHNDLLAKRTFLVLLNEDGLSMAEIKREGYCFQHLAYRNANPSKKNQELLDKWMRKEVTK